MAIDHTGLAGYEVFPLYANWATSPKSTYDVENIKKLLTFPGTAEELIQISDTLPYELQIIVDIYTKEEEQILFDFFDDHRGRWKKFWLKSPISNFIQYNDVFLGQAHIDLDPNDMEQWYTGVERIYLENGQGNSATKHIESVERLPPGSPPPSYPPKPLSYDYLRFNLDGSFVDDWLLSDVTKTLGLLRLVRFDHDDLVITYGSDRNLSVTLKLKELVYEYSEVTP